MEIYVAIFQKLWQRLFSVDFSISPYHMQLVCSKLPYNMATVLYSKRCSFYIKTGLVY